MFPARNVVFNTIFSERRHMLLIKVNANENINVCENRFRLLLAIFFFYY